ncbi:precursor of major capsid protein [Listeria phage LPJP1]|nr:precursor of major capsid protein [Listeria phage LPJP1]
MRNFKRITKTNTDSFSTHLSETQDYFANTKGTNITGQDIAAIIVNEQYFDEYATRLLEGFDADLSEELGVLLENTRSNIMESLGGITPFASLSMPVLVKLWARLSMVNAIPTTPVTTPAFVVPTIKPYTIGPDGEKYYLPEAINTIPEHFVSLRQLKEDITITGGRLSDYDLFTGVSTADRAKGDQVDRKFQIVAGTWSDSYNVADAALGEYELKGQALKMDIHGNIFGKVTYTTDGNGATNEDTIMGHVDVEKGRLDLTSLSGKLTEFKIQGFVSSEMHTGTTQVGFDVDDRTINIGTAPHIEGILPIESVQDSKAMYDIDAAAVIVDTMSATSAQKVDTDLIEFLLRSYEGTNAAYHKTFDVHPNGGYNMHPHEWRRGIRDVIDWMSQAMKNDYKTYDAYFVIVGNPIDTQLIPDIEWEFQGATDEVAGINVSYSVGASSTVNRYKVVSSDLVPAGDLLIFAVPTREDFKTYEYYPYTFNIVNNYNNAVNQSVPNIMLSRRYTVEEFVPIIGKVTIKNNDATQYAR